MRNVIAFSFLLVFAASGNLQAFSLKMPFYKSQSQKEAYVTKVIKKGFKDLTGTEIDVKGLSIEPSKDRSTKTLEIQIKRVKIKNPKGFQIPNLAFARDVRLVVEAKDLYEGRWRIHSLYANFSKVNFEMNNEEEFNLAKIPILDKPLDPALDPPSVQNFWVERYEFKVGTLYYLDLKLSDPEVNKLDFSGKPGETLFSVSDPRILVQAPALRFIRELNHGPIGISEKDLAANIERFSKRSPA